MVAGVFAEHGVWTGDCKDPDHDNEKGYFENLRIKKFFKAIWQGNPEQAVEPMPIRNRIESIISIQGYTGGPWLWKGIAFYYPTFYEFKPKYVLCRRPIEQIFDSLRGTRGLFGKHMSDEELLKFIDDQHEIMDHVPGIEVNTSDVADGNFQSLTEALEFCGIEPNREKIENFVDSDLWHYRS